MSVVVVFLCPVQPAHPRPPGADCCGQEGAWPRSTAGAARQRGDLAQDQGKQCLHVCGGVVHLTGRRQLGPRRQGEKVFFNFFCNNLINTHSWETWIAFPGISEKDEQPQEQRLTHPARWRVGFLSTYRDKKTDVLMCDVCVICDISII